MQEAFEQYLSHVFDEYPDGTVKEAALYALLNGGKRVRPKLLFSVMNAYRNDPMKGFAAGAAIEMMHTYSLIHDDLPSMDNDTLRRGKPTCHIKYGEATAILTGDALLTHSFSQAAKSSVDVHQSLAVVKELAENGGLFGMIYGQELDLQNEHSRLEKVEELEKIHHHKTGNLIALPMLVGAILVGKKEDVPVWRKIGFLIGLLFQIQDDVFDVTKSSEELGKNANSDADNEKITYVSLLGLEECEKTITKLYEEALSLLDTLVIDKKPILDIFEYLLNRKF